MYRQEYLELNAGDMDCPDCARRRWQSGSAAGSGRRGQKGVMGEPDQFAATVAPGQPVWVRPADGFKHGSYGGSGVPLCNISPPIMP